MQIHYSCHYIVTAFIDKVTTITLLWNLEQPFIMVSRLFSHKLTWDIWWIQHMLKQSQQGLELFEKLKTEQHSQQSSV